jgi:hypothetical protein
MPLDNPCTWSGTLLKNDSKCGCGFLGQHQDCPGVSTQRRGIRQWSAPLLMNRMRMWLCSVWDNFRTDLELPPSDTDELNPARGIAFGIILAIPCWIALGVLWWVLW